MQIEQIIVKIISELLKIITTSKIKTDKAYSQAAAVIPQNSLTSRHKHKKIVNIFCQNIHKYNGTFSRTGLVSKEVGCSHFLDLFSACTKEKVRNLLGTLLCRKMKKIETQIACFDFIAVSKLGNVLLVDALCQLSNKPLLVVRKKAIRFNYPIEGDFQTGKNVLVVDDIGSDGKFLLDVVLALRKYGAKVQSVMCLVNRTDSNVEKILTDNKLSYYYLYSLNDEIFQRVVVG